MARELNVFDYLLEGKSASAPALLTLKGQHTYGELCTSALAIAAFLAKAGGKRGQRAILVADNGIFWAAAYLGIIRAGLVCVPLPPCLAPEELDYIKALTEPAFVFAEAKYAIAVAGTFGNVPMICDVSVPEFPSARSLAGLREVPVTQNDSLDSLPQITPDDLAALMFTSGSTSRPRGVMVSHGNIIANTDSIIEYLKITANDRIMAVLPLSLLLRCVAIAHPPEGGRKPGYRP